MRAMQVPHVKALPFPYAPVLFLRWLRPCSALYTLLKGLPARKTSSCERVCLCVSVSHVRSTRTALSRKSNEHTFQRSAVAQARSGGRRSRELSEEEMAAAADIVASMRARYPNAVISTVNKKVCLCLCVSVSLCLCVSVSVCGCGCVCGCVWLCLAVAVALKIYLFISLVHSLSPSLTLFARLTYRP